MEICKETVIKIITEDAIKEGIIKQEGNKSFLIFNKIVFTFKNKGKVTNATLMNNELKVAEVKDISIETGEDLIFSITEGTMEIEIN